MVSETLVAEDCPGLSPGGRAQTESGRRRRLRGPPQPLRARLRVRRGPIRGLMYSVRSRPDFLNATVAPSELTTITAAEDATATCIGSMTSGLSVDAA